MKLLLIALLFLSSCTTPRGLTTGTYTIQSVNGNTVTFKEVPGRYELQSDTLKVNDQVKINVIRISKKAY